MAEPFSRRTQEISTRGWGVKTPWTLLLSADPQHAASLERLLGLYREPVYAYYRCQGLSPSDAEDLTQDLLLDFFLVRESHKNADRARGRFRNYLFTAARHALLDWKKFGGSLRRGGGKKKISLDALQGGLEHVEPTGKLSPEQEYDRQWALSTWYAALDLFRSRHDGALVQALELFYFSPERYSQQDAASKLGISAAAFNSRLYTARRHLFACLKEIVEPTVENENDMKTELEHLRELLSEHGLC